MWKDSETEIDYQNVTNDGEEVDIPIGDYVTLAECKTIALNGKNWSMFLKIAL